MSAIFSLCGTWRYRLERDLEQPGIIAALIGVNPSTAGAEVNDQTIRKDIGFGKRLGWSRIIKGNLCSYCATDVRELKRALDPIGPENDDHLAAIIQSADILIGAWGPLAKLPKYLRRRPNEVRMLAERLGKSIWCFGTAKDGQPRHTLMLAYDTPLILWDQKP